MGKGWLLFGSWGKGGPDLQLCEDVEQLLLWVVGGGEGGGVGHACKAAGSGVATGIPFPCPCPQQTPQSHI